MRLVNRSTERLIAQLLKQQKHQKPQLTQVMRQHQKPQNIQALQNQQQQKLHGQQSMFISTNEADKSVHGLKEPMHGQRLQAQQAMSISTNEADKSQQALMEAPREDLLSGVGPEIQAYPRVCLHDVPIKLTAAGLTPLSPVTFKLASYDNRGIEFSSIAHYTSDSQGEVDMTKSESRGGSYGGIFPAGLLSTLEPPAGKHAYKRLTTTDTSKPLTYVLSVHEGHGCKGSEGRVLQEIELERHMRGPGVKRVEVDSGRVRGALYIPPGPGPHPAVIDMFGASAAFMEHRSAMLASRGIMSLALPYFGYKDLPKTLKRLDIEYFEEAVDYLLSTPTAISDRCGVVATCQGGSAGIAMGVWIEKVKAVFAINTSTCLFETTLYKNNKPLIGGYNLSSDDFEFDEQHRGRFKLEHSKNTYLHPDFKCTIPIEESSEDTQFFLAVSEDCSFRAPVSLESYKERLSRAGRNNYEYKIYEGAGHIIEPPYGPHIYQNYQQYFPYKSDYHKEPEVGCYLKWGGDAHSQCRAQEQAWHDLQVFINKTIKGDEK